MLSFLAEMAHCCVCYFGTMFHFWQKWHIRGAVSANLGMPECAIIGIENGFQNVPNLACEHTCHAVCLP